MTAPQQLVQKLWKTCNILRKDGQTAWAWRAERRWWRAPRAPGACASPFCRRRSLGSWFQVRDMPVFLKIVLFLHRENLPYQENASYFLSDSRFLIGEND